VKLRVIPFILSFILLGAHFLRFGNIPLTLITLLIPFLLFIKKRWILHGLQILTLLGSLFWIKVTIDEAWVRVMAGVSWTRLALILGTVAIFTLWSAWLLSSKKVSTRYQ